MMKKRALIALSTVLGATLALSACGLTSIYKTYPARVLEGVEKKEYVGVESVNQVGNIAILNYASATDGEPYQKYVDLRNWQTVVEAKSNKTTGGTTVSEVVDYSTSNGEIAYYTKRIATNSTSGTTYEWQLIDHAGTVLATHDIGTITTYNKVLRKFGNKVYRITADNQIAFAFDYNELRGIPEAKEIGEYAYANTGAGLTVYDLSYNTVAQFAFPSVDQELGEGYLANGNYVYQGFNELPANAEEYDLFMDGDKLDLVTYIFDVDSNEIDEVDVDFVFAEDITSVIEQPSLGQLFDDSIENIAFIMPIENKRVNENEAAVKFYSVSNDLELEECMNETIPGQIYYSVPIPNTELFYAITLRGTYVIMDKSGDEIVEVADVSDYVFTANYIVDEDGVIYDHDFDLLFDCKAEDCVIVEAGAINLLLSKEKEGGEKDYFLFIDDEAEKITLTEGEIFSGSSFDYGVYSIANADETSFKYYNEEGTLLVETTGKLNNFVDTDEYVYAKHKTENGTVIYRFAYEK